VRWYSVEGTPVQVGATIVTPRSRVLSLGVRNVGFAWQLPTGVRVERDGHVERLPIVDVTRIAQFVLYGLALVALGLALTSKRKGS
jgi:hypothetical protein